MGCNCGREGCNELCNYAVGERFVRFLNEIDLISTSIGDLDTSGYSKESLIISGVQVYREGDRSTILKKSLNVTIPMEERFKDYNGKKAKVILKEYITDAGIGNGKNLTRLLKMIEDNKAVMIPFKVGQICEVLHTRVSKKEEVNGKKIHCKTTIESIRWSVENSQDKLKCVMYVAMLDPDTNKRVKVNVEDYGETFSIVDIERIHTKSSLQGRIIQMNKFGFIKPIEVYSKGTTVIIDNSNVYMKSGDTKSLKVIGEWENGVVKYREKIKPVKLEKSIEQNIQYIGKHRRWIAPYGLCDTNKLSVE